MTPSPDDGGDGGDGDDDDDDDDDDVDDVDDDDDDGDDGDGDDDDYGDSDNDDDDDDGVVELEQPTMLVDEDEDNDNKGELQQQKHERFFCIKRKPGRPRKTNTTLDGVLTQIARKKSKTAVFAAVAVGTKLKTTAAAVVTAVVAKAKRINWSKGANKRKLEQAIKDWDEKTGDRLDSNGEVIKNMKTFCINVGISYNTIKKYVHGDPKKRRTITNGVGPRPLFSNGDQQFIADTIALQDRSNNGLTPSAVIERLQEIQPGVTRKQAENHLHRTLKKITVTSLRNTLL